MINTEQRKVVKLTNYIVNLSKWIGIDKTNVAHMSRT
jgi:hypothetical protein